MSTREQVEDEAQAFVSELYPNARENASYLVEMFLAGRTISAEQVEAAANEMLRQADEDRGEDWPPSLRDFPHYEHAPGLREEYQDQWMRHARATFRAAGFYVEEGPDE